MFKFSKIAVFVAALGVSFAIFATDVDKKTEINGKTTVVSETTGKVTTEKGKVAEKVNVNTADEKQLTTIPGIGEKKAKAIVAYRTKNGNFKATEDLLQVKCRGINKKWLEKVASHVTF
jgi:competence protein ComEA